MGAECEGMGGCRGPIYPWVLILTPGGPHSPSASSPLLFSSFWPQPKHPDHPLFLQDPRAADPQSPAGVELGAGRHWDQPERPRCSHVQPPPVPAPTLVPGLWCLTSGPWAAGQ